MLQCCFLEATYMEYPSNISPPCISGTYFFFSLISECPEQSPLLPNFSNYLGRAAFFQSCSSVPKSQCHSLQLIMINRSIRLRYRQIYNLQLVFVVSQGDEQAPEYITEVICIYLWRKNNFLELLGVVVVMKCN